MRPLPGLVLLLSTAGWIVLLLLTAHAVIGLGAPASIAIFFGDFANPWRAQFNGDFTLHLVLIACWIFWRTQSKGLGLLLACLSVFCGGLFNLAYIAIALIGAKGDIRAALLGHHAGREA